LHNSGVGPAEVKSVRVTADGIPVVHWNAAMTHLLGHATPSTYSFVHGRVVGAGVELKPLELSNLDDGRAFEASLARLAVTLGYCSVLGDCWLLHSDNITQPVNRCEP